MWFDFCCNYFEVLHLYKLPANAYFIRYKVRGGAFDLVVEVTQIHIHVRIIECKIFQVCNSVFQLLYMYIQAKYWVYGETRVGLKMSL